MRAAPSWDAIREAERLDKSLDRRRAAHVGADGKPRGNGNGFVTFLGIAVPLVPFAAVALGADVSSRWWPGTLGLFVGAMAHFFAESAARRTPFEALRFPDPGALLFARFRRKSSWLLWVGACLGALRAVQMTQQGVGSTTAIAATVAVLVVAPLCFTALCTAYVAAESRANPIRVGPWAWIKMALLAGAAAALPIVGVAGLFDDGFIFMVFLHPRGAGLVSFVRAGRRSAAAAAAGAAWLAGVCSVAGGVLRARSPAAQDWTLVTLILLFLFALVATPLLVRWAARQRPVVGKPVEAKAAESRAPWNDARAEGERARPIRRARSGGGLAAATRRNLAIRVRHARPERESHMGTKIAWWLIAMPLALAWHGRAVLGSAAVVLWADSMSMSWTAFALLVATTAPSMSAAGLAPRLYLFGADARDLVRNQLTSLATIGAAPSLAAGAVVAAWRSFDAPSLGALATIAACFVLRAGWRGFVGEASSVSGPLCTIGTAILLAVFSAHLPASADALRWAAAVAAVGAIGAALRLAASESSLRDTMRRAR